MCFMLKSRYAFIISILVVLHSYCANAQQTPNNHIVSNENIAKAGTALIPVDVKQAQTQTVVKQDTKPVKKSFKTQKRKSKIDTSVLDVPPHYSIFEKFLLEQNQPKPNAVSEVVQQTK